MTEPWHMAPTHACAPGAQGPVVENSAGFFCAACGCSVGGLSDADKARVRAAEKEWDEEQDRQERDGKARAEHDRKVPLLAEAIARRKAGIV